MDKMDTKKREILKALEDSLGVVSTACASIDMPRSTFYKWLKEDAEFKSEVDALQDFAIDTVESELFKKIKGGDTTAIIFFLKTKAKKRGYIERQEVSGVDGRPIQTEGKHVVEFRDYGNSSAVQQAIPTSIRN